MISIHHTPWLRALLVAAFFLGPLGCASSGGREVLRRGIDQAEGGDMEGAISTLESGASEYPGDINLRFQLARYQYEMGEDHHLRELQAHQAAEVFLQRNSREEAAANQRTAHEHRARALPYYQAARENLRHVSDNASDDVIEAWAYYLLARVDVFFEDYESAHEHLERAILHGRPTGSQLAQMREFQAQIRDRIRRDRSL